MSSNGVKNYTESNTLLQYQGKIELNPDDPSYIAQKNRENSTIDSNPSLSDTLNSKLPYKKVIYDSIKYYFFQLNSDLLFEIYAFCHYKLIYIHYKNL